MILHVVYETLATDYDFPIGEPVIICSSQKQCKKWFDRQNRIQQALVIQFIMNNEKDWINSRGEYKLRKENETLSGLDKFIQSCQNKKPIGFEIRNASTASPTASLTLTTSSIESLVQELGKQ